MEQYLIERFYQLHDILHDILGYLEAQEQARPLLRFVDDNVREFPVKKAPTVDTMGASNTEKGGFIEDGEGILQFTEKEYLQMPARFKNVLILNKKRCRVRRRACGYEIRYRSNGYNVSASGQTLDLAKANFLQKIKTAKPVAEKNVNTVPTTFGAFALYFLENFKKVKVTEQTYRGIMNRYELHLLSHFGEKPLVKITPTDCKAVLDRLVGEGKGKTADEVNGLLYNIFDCALAHGLIPRNPMVMVVHVQHVRESGTALTHEEERTLLFGLDEPYKTVAALLLFAGLRPNELYTAKIEGPFIVAVNSKRKNRKVEYKKIPICDALRPFLPADNVIHVPTLDILRRRVRALCPGHKVYDLRTTFYSRCKEYGVSEHALKEFAGHSLGALGNAYTDLSDEYLLKEGSKLNAWTLAPHLPQNSGT